MTPLQLTLKPERRTLAITWDGGDISLIPASVLRRAVATPKSCVLPWMGAMRTSTTSR